MSNPLKDILNETPQNEKALGKNQVRNSAGGYVFAVDKWDRLRRFLILGSEGGTFYISAPKLSRENAENVIKCIEDDPAKVLMILGDIVTNRKAPRMDPAMFTLALFVTICDKKSVLQELYRLFPSLVKTGYHLFTFVDYVDDMRSWGRYLRKLVGSWYLEKNVQDLMYQVFKYKNRKGWSHRDILRLSHPNVLKSVGKHGYTDPNQEYDENPVEYVNKQDMSDFFEWICRPDGIPTFTKHENQVRFNIFNLMEHLGKHDEDKKEDAKMVIELIQKNKFLTWENVPSNLLGDKNIWTALTPNLPYHALIRNLARLSSLEIIAPLTQTSKDVSARIRDPKNTAKIHPLNLLSALKTYKAGKGFRGNLTWKVNPTITGALNKALEGSFGYLPPLNKNIMVGLDVSGSMLQNIGTLPNVTCMEAGAVLAKMFCHQNPETIVKGFSNHWSAGYHNHNLKIMNINDQVSFSEAMDECNQFDWGGTDCALPMMDAIKNNHKVDCFIVITDSDTWAGRLHPFEALKKYRQHSGINAKLVVVAMTSNGFTIANPADKGMLDVVGFDTSVPAILENFILE